MKHVLPLLLVMALTSCVSSPAIRWAPLTDFEFIIADNPAHQRFDVTLTSKANAPLCLSKEAWPTAAGLPAGFDGATLTTSTGKKELLPTGSAYCPGGCGNVRLEPGQLLAGMVPYAAFGDAPTIAADPSRKLQFVVHPFVCSG